MNNIIEFILDLIYPPKCAICGKDNKNYVCKNCLNMLENEEIFKIDDIKGKSFDQHIYLYEYKTIIRKKIIELKFKDKDYLYKFFAYILKNNKKICAILNSYDIITAVPMHHKKQKIRGYNQIELIAKELQNDNLKYMKLLEKTINTKNQVELKREERINNLKNAYKIIQQKNKIEQKKILLFDDIYTTGSTADECTKQIKKYNPKKIGVLTIAKDFIK